MTRSPEHVMRLLRAANPVSEIGDAMRVVDATDPVWQTITARVQQEEHDMDPSTRPTRAPTPDRAATQPRRLVAVVAAVFVVVAAIGTWTLVGGDDQDVEPIGDAPPGSPQDITLRGPAVDSTAGRMEVSGTAVEQGTACPEVRWSNTGIQRDDGTAVGANAFLDVLSQSTELTWTEEYTCLDGSGAFELRHDPLMTGDELDARQGEVTEFTTWTVVVGRGAFEGVTGEGVLVFDFTDGAPHPSGEAQLRGELTFP